MFHSCFSIVLFFAMSMLHILIVQSLKTENNIQLLEAKKFIQAPIYKKYLLAPGSWD